jgi:MFS family permease
MTAIVIPLAFEKHGLDGMQIGMMMAVLLLVMVPVGLLMPALMRCIDMRVLLVLSTVLRGGAMWVFPQYQDVYHWAALLAVYGIGEFAFIFIVQAWMGLVPFKRGSGFILSMLGAAISVGISVSAVAVEVLQSRQVDMYLAMAVITVAGLFPLLISFLWTPSRLKPSGLTLRSCFKQNPLVMVAALVVGLQLMGVQYLIVIYGTRAGLDFTKASFLLAAFTMGPIIFEVTLASLSDKFDRRNVLMAGTFLSLVCAIYLPLAIYYPFVAYILLFIWGGIIGGLYSVSIAILRDRFEGNDLVPALANFTVMFGVGGVLGLLSIGSLMDVFGSTDALPTTTNVANFIFFCFAANRYIKSLSEKAEQSAQVQQEQAA